MITATGNNLNSLFDDMLELVEEEGVFTGSRNGDTLEVPEPVSVCYEMPNRRVLFNPERDANPFFHLFEALWMLAGRDDVGFLDRYNSQMKQYSDDGVRFNAAYGYRLRNHFDIDQLDAVITKLRTNPRDRQAVLQLWDSSDLFSESKDKACNLAILPRIRDNALDWTVYNRSNDLIYGMLGANVVHMSIIQEYVAAMIGVDIGMYWQITNCLHAYVDNPVWQRCIYALHEVKGKRDYDLYKHRLVKPYPLVSDRSTWDKDLLKWMENPIADINYDNDFFKHVARPMAVCFDAHKNSGTGLYYVSDILATDWKFACVAWLEKRERNV